MGLWNNGDSLNTALQFKKSVDGFVFFVCVFFKSYRTHTYCTNSLCTHMEKEYVPNVFCAVALLRIQMINQSIV